VTQLLTSEWQKCLLDSTVPASLLRQIRLCHLHLANNKDKSRHCQGALSLGSAQVTAGLSLTMLHNTKFHVWFNHNASRRDLRDVVSDSVVPAVRVHRAHLGIRQTLPGCPIFI